MKLSPFLRLISNPTLESLKKLIKQSVDETPQYLKQLKENRQTIVYDKIYSINKWYTRIIGLDEVKILQDKVISIQDKLLDVQERRREIGRQLTDIRQKSIELQDQIHKVKRQDDMDRFLELMKAETEVLKLEQSVSRTFQDCDKTEREIFTAFTNAIRDSHEKQRTQMEYTKYFGLMLGIAGSFLTFVYSTLRKHDLKMFIEKQLRNEATKNELAKVSEQVNEISRLVGYSNNKIEAISISNTPYDFYSNNQQKVQELETLIKICGGIGVLILLLFAVSRS